MTFPQLVGLYEEGRITAGHLIVEILNRVDSINVDTEMGALPQHLYGEFKAFLDSYKAGEMLTSLGPIPPPESIAIAKAWLRSREKLGVGSR